MDYYVNCLGILERLYFVNPNFQLVYQLQILDMSTLEVQTIIRFIYLMTNLIIHWSTILQNQTLLNVILIRFYLIY